MGKILANSAPNLQNFFHRRRDRCRPRIIPEVFENPMRQIHTRHGNRPAWRKRRRGPRFEFRRHPDHRRAPCKLGHLKQFLRRPGPDLVPHLFPSLSQFQRRWLNGQHLHFAPRNNCQGVVGFLNRKARDLIAEIVFAGHRIRGLRGNLQLVRDQPLRRPAPGGQVDLGVAD